jgi:hypothetical protein
MMIQLSDLKVGTLIWWTAQRYVSVWDTPGVIVNIDDDAHTFSVLTFDDCKVTVLHHPTNKPNPDTDSTLREMRVTTKTELKRYFQDKARRLEDGIIAAERELEDAKTKLQDWNTECATIESKYLS